MDASHGFKYSIKSIQPQTPDCPMTSSPCPEGLAAPRSCLQMHAIYVLTNCRNTGSCVTMSLIALRKMPLGPRCKRCARARNSGAVEPAIPTYNSYSRSPLTP